MNLFAEAIAWLTDPDQYAGPSAIPIRIGEHLFYTFLSVLIAAVIAIPLGYFIGHTGKGREIAIGISGAARALPSFGLILLLVLLIGVTQKPLAAFIAFVLLGIPSILAGAYSGLEAIDRRVIDSARAVGMTEWQILWKVEIPLGLPLLIGGIRSAALQIVATVTLAAYIGLGGLGLYIIKGLALRQFDQMLGAALVVVALALIIDGLFALLQRIIVPRGVAAGRTSDTRTRSTRPRAGAEISANQ
ncbi:osmoprotectant transport system permease protein [Conyzicola lurida]|uniref:Osmoprotectant transport system permease protein n=1 Tax=Conyzicola lurida TaxID=1172621 RepID=A0A841ANC7_9MICO|nr:ABC transporter permease [Conyzicola lurida]MBB5843442.1 osmoprotectant transport system permease protein [Conyzicola lurida]